MASLAFGLPFAFRLGTFAFAPPALLPFIRQSSSAAEKRRLVVVIEPAEPKGEHDQGREGFRPWGGRGAAIGETVAPPAVAILEKVWPLKKVLGHGGGVSRIALKRAYGCERGGFRKIGACSGAAWSCMSDTRIHFVPSNATNALCRRCLSLKYLSRFLRLARPVVK